MFVRIAWIVVDVLVARVANDLYDEFIKKAQAQTKG